MKVTIIWKTSNNTNKIQTATFFVSFFSININPSCAPACESIIGGSITKGPSKKKTRSLHQYILIFPDFCKVLEHIITIIKKRKKRHKYVPVKGIKYSLSTVVGTILLKKEKNARIYLINSCSGYKTLLPAKNPGTRNWSTLHVEITSK